MQWNSHLICKPIDKPYLFFLYPRTAWGLERSFGPGLSNSLPWFFHLKGLFVPDYSRWYSGICYTVLLLCWYVLPFIPLAGSGFWRTSLLHCQPWVTDLSACRWPSAEHTCLFWTVLLGFLALWCLFFFFFSSFFIYLHLFHTWALHLQLQPTACLTLCCAGWGLLSCDGFELAKR